MATDGITAVSDLKALSPTQLLSLYAQVSDELRERGVVRSANNPTGDLAEHLFCKAYGWKQAGQAHPAADATGEDGKLYQIKERRWNAQNKSRVLGALRALPDGGFDFLAAVLFRSDYTIERAAIIPHALVLDKSHYHEHTNSWRFLLRDAVWKLPSVEDATDRLRAVVF